MYIGLNMLEKHFIDVIGNCDEEVVIREDGCGVFKVKEKSVSVWVKKKIYYRKFIKEYNKEFMNLKKKKVFKKICIFIITILILSNPVMANQEQQEDKYKNYDLENIGIKISLEKNFIEMVSSLKNNGENVSNIENKEEYLQNYKNAGIILDAVDNIENPTKRNFNSKKPVVVI